MFVSMLTEEEETPEKYEFLKLRKGVMAGSICPGPLMEKVIEKMGIN